MADRLVLDASAALHWLFDESPDAQRLEDVLRDAHVVVPWLWRLEVVNAVVVRERRGLLKAEQGQHLLEIMDDWTVEVIGDSPADSLKHLANVARQHQLSAYDTAYLLLAASLGLPLLSTDQKLMAAAEQHGVARVAW